MFEFRGNEQHTNNEQHIQDPASIAILAQVAMADCPICLGGLNNGETVFRMSLCNHGLHWQCVANDYPLETCPLCLVASLISELSGHSFISTRLVMARLM